MDHRSIAGRRKIDLAGIGLGLGNKLRNRLGRNRWIDLHDKRATANACDRRSVADEIEIQPIVKCDGNRVCRNDQKERMAVGGRTRDRLGADVARSARSVLNDEWLAEALGQPLTDQARDDVGRAAGRKADDDAYRPRR